MDLQPQQKEDKEVLRTLIGGKSGHLNERKVKDFAPTFTQQVKQKLTAAKLLLNCSQTHRSAVPFDFYGTSWR